MMVGSIPLMEQQAAAMAIGCELSWVQAIMEIEAPRGPFEMYEGAQVPATLFERHYFHRLTKGKFDKTAPDLSNSKSGGYGKYSAQWPKLLRARELDASAANQSASWGAFQVMGANWKLCGFASLKEFVDAMSTTGGQVRAFVGYIKGAGLVDACVRKDALKFAIGYNGPAQEGYDDKIRAAYDRHRRLNVGKV
ncbi:MAG TPA: N-acetylmuramidase family protein [Bradyrhizobium sp.]|nr:N-acetylmuramidase family protein [Bradyrhizobium sp.]